MKKILRLSAEYLAPPIFDPGIDTMGHVEPEELGLPPDLSAAIHAWDDAYQRTFDADYPPASKSPQGADLLAHNQLGAALATRLQQFLGPGFEIAFVPLTEVVPKDPD